MPKDKKGGPEEVQKGEPNAQCLSRYNGRLGSEFSRDFPKRARCEVRMIQDWLRLGVDHGVNILLGMPVLLCLLHSLKKERKL